MPAALEFLIWTMLFFTGASIGSFLNVVALRIPEGESVVAPSSRCPHCHTRIPWWALIPVLGWVFIRGRCHHCKAPVPLRYPLMEVFVGGVSLWLCFHHLGPHFVPEVLMGIEPRFGVGRYEGVTALATSLFFFWTAVPLILIDWEWQILPDVITLPGIVVGFLLGCLNPELGWNGSLLGVVVGGGGLLAIALLYKNIKKIDGMGFGDVKYLALIGAVVGWQGVIFVMIFAAFSGLLYGIPAALISGNGILRMRIPFGPFLALGGFAVLLWGDTLTQFLFPPPP